MDDVDLTGRTLAGRYRILRKLGAGGMGAVYVALQEQLDRQVAVKVLRSALERDSHAALRFQREARALAQLKHPAIVDVFDFDVDVDSAGIGRAFIAMELVEGISLRQRLERGPMPWRETMAAVRAIAEGLAGAHKVGIVHRDLKPDNVVVVAASGAAAALAGSPPVKLLDFGVASIDGPAMGVTEDDRPLTATGAIVGSAGYIAPEMVLENVTDDPRSDLYSLGVLWFEMLAGVPPFAAATPLALVMKHATEPAPTLASMAPDPDRPLALDALVGALLSKKRTDRPTSADVLIQALDALDPASLASPWPLPLSSSSSSSSSNVLGRRSHNLPARLGQLIGRERELVDIGAQIKLSRLVTLTGAGGSGKSRLAIQLALDALPRMRDGVWLVELAPIGDPHDVVQAVARALRISAAAGQTLRESVVDDVRARELLLILDNCEHVIDECARLVDELLGAGPGVHILTTSREPLGVDGEVARRLPSLATPSAEELEAAGGDVVNVIARFDAVRLFVERAVAADPTFVLTTENAAAVCQICARLDGVPLAIELAAARVRALGASEVQARLDDRFRLLTSGSRTALPRQQTLRALIDWSYALLSPAEKILLGRLAVFSGGFSLVAVAAICCDLEPGTTGSRPSKRGAIGGVDVVDLLTQLVNKSLVNVIDDAGQRPGAELRYSFLETIREYASEKLLESDDVKRCRDRHMRFFLGLAEEIAQGWFTADQRAWSKRSNVEHQNLRQAMQWSQGDLALTERFVASLCWTWHSGGFKDEGRRWVELVVGANRGARTARHAIALIAFGNGLVWAGEGVDAEVQLAEAVSILRELGELRDLSMAQTIHAGILYELGEIERARSLATESLARALETNHPVCAAIGTSLLHDLALTSGDLDEAERLADFLLTGMRAAEHPEGIAWGTQRMGGMALRRGDALWAAQLAVESLSIFVALRNVSGITAVAVLAGRIALAQARNDLALAALTGVEVALKREKLAALHRDRVDLAEGLAQLAAVIGHDAVARGRQRAAGLGINQLTDIARRAIIA